MALRATSLNSRTNDIEFDSPKSFKIISDADAIRQRLRIRLSINRGEWFLNTDIGVPWHNLFDGNASKDQFMAEIRKEIMAEEEVQSVDYISVENVDKQKRIIKLDFKATLKNGESISATEVVNI